MCLLNFQSLVFKLKYSAIIKYMKKTKTIFNFITYLIFFFSGNAYCKEWKLISKTTYPDKNINWYVDVNSIVHEDNFVKAFLRTTWSIPQFGPNKTAYQSSTYLNYFDCDSKKIAYTANTYFNDLESIGNPVHEEPEKPLEELDWHKVIPKSAGAIRLKFVCKYRSKSYLT